MHEVVSSNPIVMHIFHILLYWHILWYTGIYKYVLVWTCILVYELTHNVCTGMYAVVLRRTIHFLVHTDMYQYIDLCICTHHIFISIYEYVQVHTSMYMYILYSIIWYHATVRDSGYLDVRCPASLVPINPLSYRHIQTYIDLSGFVEV